MKPLIRKEVRKLAGYHLGAPRHTIKLNQNESPWDLPPALKKKTLARLKKAPWNRYPTPFCDSLREKIARNENWSPEGVVVSGGSNILIQALIIAGSVGKTILTVTPGFSLYEIEGALLNNRVVKVPLRKAEFSFPREIFLKKIKSIRPEIIFLANPNAPTGNLFSEDDLLAVMRQAQGLVVIDEAYYPFSGKTMAFYLKKYKNLVLVRTLSKAFSLGGVRLGYLLADPSIAKECLKVVLPFSIGILSQIVGEAVLDEPEYVKRIIEKIIKERAKLYEGLQSLQGLRVYPSHANYLLFQSKKSSEIFDGLLKKGILIRDVSSKDLPNALRVTVGTSEENKKFLEAMYQILEQT